ncbi:S41 family peptidase [Crateriforma spongiae]|uniref:S41 family peptidase n=1 Tax=Crateriforma spongiae TaxID=2724528 RepID=UPI0039AF830B
MPPRHLNFILFSAMVSLACYTTYQFIRPAIVVGDAIQLIDRYYVEPIDTDKLVDGAMDGVTGQLDENSSFIAQSDYQAFQDTINQEFAGIGILIEQPDEDQPVRVITPMVGSPALAAGFRPGDLIVRVEQTDTSAMTISDVSSLLRGPIGTQVDVGVRRGDETFDLSVKRESIPLESVVGDHRDADDRWVYRLKEDPRIAYIRLTTFGEKTPEELEAVLRDLDNDFEAMILDVRGNGGGLLTTAVSVCDMFLSDGLIVSTKIRGGVPEDRWEASPGVLVNPEIPLVVMVNGGSASASEIVAACFQDRGRAAVAGVRSYGKGTVQNILPLQFGRSALRLTVATFYRPSDRSIHRGLNATEEDDWGVKPNPGLVVPITESQAEKIADRWLQASYPLLAQEAQSEADDDTSATTDEESPPNDDSSANSAEDSSDSSGDTPMDDPLVDDGDVADPPLGPPITDDPPLDQAIHYLRDLIRQDALPDAPPQAVAA